MFNHMTIAPCFLIPYSIYSRMITYGLSGVYHQTKTTRTELTLLETTMWSLPIIDHLPPGCCPPVMAILLCWFSFTPWILQDGAPKIAFSRFINGWNLWFMVDITIDNYGIHGVYKPTNITGGLHPVGHVWYISSKILPIFQGCSYSMPK